MANTTAGIKAAHAAIHSPERVAKRRAETDRRLRFARNVVGEIRIRWQPYIWTGAQDSTTYSCLPGTVVQVVVSDVIDFWDLLRDTKRLWACWRPDRRRTEQGKASVQRAWELLERSASDLKP